MASRFISTARLMFAQPNFVGLLLSTMTLGVAYSFFSPFISTWGTQEVGMSPPMFSLFMTLTSLCGITVGTAMGRLSDTRFARRHVLILAAAGGALGYLGYAQFRHPLLLLLVGCGVLSLSAGCFAQLFAHVREEYRNNDQMTVAPGLMMSILRVSFSFSWTVGPATGSVILVVFGFKGLFSVAALLWCIFLAGIIWFVPYRPRPPRKVNAPKDSMWATLKRTDIAICFSAFVILFAASSINMMNLPLSIIHMLGGTERDFGIVFGIGPLVEIPMMIWFGHLASRGHQSRLIRFGFFLSLLYFTGLSFTTAPWHVYLLQIISGIMIAVTSNVGITFFQDLIPSQPGLTTALYSNAMAAGNLLGILSFGFIVDTISYRGVFVACAVLSLLAILVILQLRPSPTPPPQESHPAPAGA